MSPGSGTEGQASVAGGETGGLETGGPGSFTNCGTIDFGDFQGPQAKARSGDMYNTRVRCKRSSSKGSSDRRSIAHKTPKESYPFRLERGSACGLPRQSPANPGAVRARVQQRSPQTSPGPAPRNAAADQPSPRASQRNPPCCLYRN